MFVCELSNEIRLEMIRDNEMAVRESYLYCRTRMTSVHCILCGFNKKQTMQLKTTLLSRQTIASSVALVTAKLFRPMIAQYVRNGTHYNATHAAIITCNVRRQSCSNSR